MTNSRSSSHLVLLLVATVVAAFIFMLAYGSHDTKRAASHAPATIVPKCKYRARGALPSATCTPGAAYSGVTQRTIKKTICVKGWTDTVRPASSITSRMKLKSMQEYGATGSPSAYEYDHLIPLQLGGALDNPRNLWPEPHQINGANSLGSFDKDGAESHLRALVCAGKMKLAAARRIMRTDWRTAPE
jgi:hypothetical protein